MRGSRSWRRRSREPRRPALQRLREIHAASAAFVLETRIFFWNFLGVLPGIFFWDFFFGFSWLNFPRISSTATSPLFKNGRKSRGDVSAQHPPNSRRVRGGGGLASDTRESRARQRLGPRASPRARAPRARDTTPARTRATSKPSPPGVARSPPARPRPQRVPSPLPPLGPRRGRARDGDDVIAPGSAALPRPAGTFEGDARAPPAEPARGEPRGTGAPFASKQKKTHVDAPSRKKKNLALTLPTPHARAAWTGVLRPAPAREQRAALRPV